MKRKAIFLCSVLGIITLFSIGVVSTVQAARSQDSTCSSSGNPNDQDYFPFGFFCGSHSNGYKGDVPLVGTTYNGNTGGGWQEIEPNQTLDFTAEFTSNEKAQYSDGSPAADVNMWVTIDINNSMFGGWSNLPADSNTSHACPGATLPTGNSENIVYNYQTEGGYIDSHDASPASYTGTLGAAGPTAGSEGYENCGTQGRLIYWEFSSVGANTNRKRNFSIKVTGQEGKFCVRENVSVKYPGDHVFFQSNLANRDTHSTLARVAKQSDRHCYEVVNHPPSSATGTLDVTACTKYKVNGWDPDHINSPVEYKLTYGASSTLAASGTTRRTDTSIRTYSFVKNRTYVLKVKDLDNGQWYTVDNDSWTTSCAPTVSGGSCSSWHENIPGQYTAGNVTYETRMIISVIDNDAPGHALPGQNYGYAWNAPGAGHPGSDLDLVYTAMPNIKVTRSYEYHLPTATVGDDEWWPVPGGQWPKVTTYECYRATCDLEIVGEGPDGIVVRGGPYTGAYTVNGIIKNEAQAAYPNIISMPQSLNDNIGGPVNFPLGITNSAGQHDATDGVDLGSTVDPSWTGTAASAPGSVTETGYPDYYGKMGIGPPCPKTVKVYEYFELSGNSTATYDPNDEDPTNINYTTYVKNDATGSVDVGTTSCLYKVPDSCSSGALSGPFGGGTYASGITYTQGAAPPGLPATHAVNIPVKAGDTYCSEIKLDYTIGYRGSAVSSDIAYPSGEQTFKTCPPIADKPFFKASGAGVSAGGNFSSTSGGSCTGGGILAGWFNNKVSGYSFGSSSQLSALALLRTTGFASAQTVASRSPSELSFANQPADVFPDTYNAGLGGNFNPTGNKCLPSEKVKSDALNLPTSVDISGHNSVNLSTLAAGSYKYSGSDLTIVGDNAYPNSKNVSIFADSNVYIRSDIRYTGAGTWANKAAVPSFILHATKNIYIDPDVSALDGLYTAEPAVAGTFGTIYTCGDYSTGILKPVDRAQLFDCNNQLLVHGSFIADHINLMRSYGSLRDEKSVGAGSQTDVIWSCGGDTCNPSKTNYDCTVKGVNVNITGEPAAHTWADNYLCVRNGSSTVFKISITTVPNTIAQAKINTGQPFCTSLNIPGEDAYWADNYLCSNVDFQFSYSGPIAGRVCTQMYEPSDQHASDVWKEAQHKTYICEPTAAVGSPASPLVCSHGVADGAKREVTYTCAAEVFEFSPEMYLSLPAIDQPNGGAPILQASTSLPPVL